MHDTLTMLHTAESNRAMFGALMAKMNESLYHVGLHGNRVLFALAEVVMPAAEPGQPA